MTHEGIYYDRGRWSYTVIGVYLILIVLIILILPRTFTEYWALAIVLFLFAFFLARYLSTIYSMNDTHFRSWRVGGSRRIPLATIRRIEYGSMHDLAATGFFGAWGWRGRMWSPEIGPFDAVYTDPVRGLLLTGEGVPIYISPNDLDGFARELSRRVRSYSAVIDVDVGAPPTPERTE